MRVFLAIAFLGFITLCSAQTTLYNTANVFVNDSAKVHVFGNFVTDGASSTLEHRGFIQTYADGNPGNFELRNLGNVHSTGNYRINNDWINDGVLQIDTGWVEMYGDNQWFDGDSVSSFFDLKLTGTDAKEQAQDIRVRNLLELNDRELAVHAQKLFIDNNLATAISYNPAFGLEGIISTDEDGIIRKVMLQNQLNVIPTGSNEGGIFRHRPVKANLINPTQDTLFVTFHHHSPDLLGLPVEDHDTSLCKIQDRYFFTINAADSSNHFELDFAHYPPSDGYFPDLAKWNSPTWISIYDHTDYSDVNYSYVSANDESDFVHEHYSLSYRTPVAPYLMFDTTECYTTAQYQVETPLGEPWYEWSVLNSNNSAFIAEGQGTDLATVDWADSIGGLVYVYYQDTAGCWSHQTFAEVEDVSIQADFHYQNDYSNGTSTEYQFVDNSSSNVEEIEWTIEGNSSPWIDGPQMEVPYLYNFTGSGENETYEAMLVAHDWDYGCYDTLIRSINVPNIYTFYAPVSFTPDEDGINETFFGYASDITYAEMTIFNRWGEVVFEKNGLTAEELVWDGTYQGQKVQSGTYLYRFVLHPLNYNVGEKGALEFTGHVSLLR